MGALTAVRRFFAVTTAALVAGAMLVVGPAMPASAASYWQYLCSGYSGCASAGYGNGGYSGASGTSYWTMYPGHNCVNYVAYRLIKNGAPSSKPWPGYGNGNANLWGPNVKAQGYPVNNTPAVGAVAWFDSWVGGAGSAGHVAYVESVSSDQIIVSEDNYGGDFYWRVIKKGTTEWPSAFLHIADVPTSFSQTYSPTISGVPAKGETLKASVKAWSPKAAFSYQWYADGKALAKKTSRNLKITSGLVGKRLQVRVTGKKAYITTRVKYSSQTAAVSKYSFTGTYTPTISGKAIFGQKFTANTTAWKPAGVTLKYQWAANGVAISGATGSTFTVSKTGWVGKKISVTVTGVKKDYASQSKMSSQSATIVPATQVSTPTPTVVLSDAADLNGDGKPSLDETLVVKAGTWDSGVSRRFQWYANSVAIAGATSTSYTVTSAEADKTIKVRVTGTRTGYTQATKVSAATDSITYSVLEDDFAPRIVGDHKYAEKLTANPRTWRVTANQELAATDLAYLWFADGVVISGATKQTLTLNDKQIGKQITVRASYRKSGYLRSVRTSDENYSDLSDRPVVQALQFASTPTPQIKGIAKYGQTLTATTGIWRLADDTPIGLSAIKYQWLRNGVPIPGATTKSYTLTTSDIGKAITFKASTTRTGYVAVAKTSAATDSVEALRFTDKSSPTLSGTAKWGKTLTAKVPARSSYGASGITIKYRWYRDGVTIPSATGLTYKLTVADIGKSITFKVIVTKPGYRMLTQASKATAKVAALKLTGTPTPGIKGSAVYGKTLQGIHRGTWSPSPLAIKYQWYRNGVAIPGATAKSYTLAVSDIGKKITFRVTGSKTGYATVSKTSAATVAVKPLEFTAKGNPSIKGKAEFGQTLTGAQGASWTPRKVTMSYQWLRDGVAIDGATTKTYKLTESDIGATITFKVTGSKTGYRTQSQEATLTGEVARANFTEVRVPTIAGTLKVGKTVTAVRGNWQPTPESYTFQWYRNTGGGSKAISGATAKSYVLTAADEGATLRVRMIVTKTGYSSQNLVSVATAKVE